MMNRCKQKHYHIFYHLYFTITQLINNGSELKLRLHYSKMQMVENIVVFLFTTIHHNKLLYNNQNIKIINSSNIIF